MQLKADVLLSACCRRKSYPTKAGGRLRAVIADKAYGTDGIRSFVAARGAWADTLPRLMREGTFASSRCVYRQRNLIERSVHHLKQMRSLAT